MRFLECSSLSKLRIYSISFTCQKEQTGSCLRTLAFPRPSQANAIEDLGIYEQFFVEISIIIHFL